MQYDRVITISAANSRKSIDWKPQRLRWSEFVDRLRTPTRSTETLAAYLAMKKPQQDELKDVGGFVGGRLTGRRKKGAVECRDLVTLDMDNLPPGGTDEVLRRVDGLGVGCVLYSTRKHRPEAPRLRLVAALDRSVSAEEYEPLARKLAALLQPEMTWFDPTTFQPERLMYWPSCCSDGAYVFWYADKPLLHTDGALALYSDWHDMTAWPVVPGEAKIRANAAKRQGDPTEKPGVVGAFCRVYDIETAMDKFLPGVYAETLQSGRYTYSAGSTVGGAVLYDDGKFLYSHHATDPCGGQLVNAFDLVRLHKFAELDDDDEVKPGTPPARLPSYDAMCRFAVADEGTAAELGRMRRQQAAEDFAELARDSAEPDDDWMKKLALHPRSGQVLPTIDNCWTILEHDPDLAGRFALNEFTGRGEILHATPWDPAEKRRPWEDADNSGLYWFMEKTYDIKSSRSVDMALALHEKRHQFNDVTAYLNSLQWDGVPRLDTLLIDYLGAEDTPYVRAVTRKAFTAAVARAMSPGCEYQTMLIVHGAQGLGKTTLLRTMGGDWFTDALRTFEGKEAGEIIQGMWLVEVGELGAMNRTEVERIKQFLSQRIDRFRAAYGRHVKDLPRRCVFFGTTNETEFLRDRTGGRRFWPVLAGSNPAPKSVWKDLPEERGQLWAEAVRNYQNGEPLHLTGEIEEMAKQQQEQHRQVSVREGVIRDFIEQPVPPDWGKWALDRRLLFWSGAGTYDGELVPRERVCALEIWCEALGGSLLHIKNSDAAEINSVVGNAEGWKRMSKPARFGYCKVQRGFIKGVTK